MSIDELLSFETSSKTIDKATIEFEWSEVSRGASKIKALRLFSSFYCITIAFFISFLTFYHDTVWLSIDQMAELFQQDKSVIGKHVRNIFKEGELAKESVWAKFAYTASDGTIRKVCKRRRTSEIGVAHRGNDLGAMALAVASELFYGSPEPQFDMDEERTYLNAIIRIRDGFERKEKMSDVYLFWQLVNGWAELIHKMW